MSVYIYNRLYFLGSRRFFLISQNVTLDALPEHTSDFQVLFLRRHGLKPVLVIDEDKSCIQVVILRTICYFET